MVRVSGGGAAATLAAIAGIVFLGCAAYAPDADPGLLQAAALPATAEQRCQGCGWIESHRELGALDSKDGTLAVFQYTVRMRDGSSRVFEELPGVKWRLGERLIYIN